MLKVDNKKYAYFSMEVGVDQNMPTYSGGLGILSGDTLKSCADLRVSIVGVSLLNEHGFFYQKLDEHGNQIEMPVNWSLDDFLEKLPTTITVHIEGRPVKVGVWKHDIVGHSGHIVPLFMLDTNFEENTEYDRSLTQHLYGGDHRYRLNQEKILGVAGVRMLRALGCKDIERFHMNEGHAAFATLELLKEFNGDIESVKQRCVFTTHTPVPAGHDKFHRDEINNTFQKSDLLPYLEKFYENDFINMTRLALRLTHYVNGVAKKHQEISQRMFPRFDIHAITNGVHARSWTSPAFASLFDKYFPAWRDDSFTLRSGLMLPNRELWEAHRSAKKALINFVNETSNSGFDYDIFTIGFARRAATYKRGGLLFTDIERLIRISDTVGKIQIVFAGKAHPHDQAGKDIIRFIFEKKEQLRDKIRIAYLENYDITKAKLLVAGVDLWLNTPRRPYEASGTSGMKACLNGIPSLSTLDGWWIEGCVEHRTGWSIGDMSEDDNDDYLDAMDMYKKLEKDIIPLYYNNREEWIRVMKYCIAFNGSYFNTQRMMQQYVTNAYR